MKSWHSTSLRAAQEHCIQAAAWLEEGKAYDREIFATGSAAHAILEAVGRKTNQKGEALTERELDVVSRAVCSTLATEGRTYEGEPEPPLSADACFAGRDLALDFLASHPIDQEPEAKFEIGLAIDAKGDAATHEPSAFYRGILDKSRLAPSDEDELGRSILTVRDYKSAWGMREGILKSTQVRGYALMALAYYGASRVDVLRLECANLRTGKIYVEEVYLPDEEAIVEEWRADLIALVKARRKQKVEAAPGAGCLDCPFAGGCKPATAYFLATLSHAAEGDEISLERLARTYATTKGLVANWGRALQAATKGGSRISTGDGEVGYFRKDQKTLVDDGPGLLWDEWETMGGDGRGFALALGLGMRNAEELGKFLVGAKGSTKAQNEQILEEVTTTKAVEKFDVIHEEVGR